MRNQRPGTGNARDNGSSKPVEGVAALGALALLAALVAAGWFLLSHRAKQPEIEMLVGADISGSIGDIGRKNYFAMLDETVDSVLPKQSLVSLWAYDVNAHKFGAKRPDRSEDLWPVEDEIISTKSDTQGTYPSVVLKEMLDEAARVDQNHGRIALMLLTDAEDANPKESLRLMTQLAALKSVKAIWICGATTQNGFRSLVERNYTNLLGDRLIVSSANDAQEGLNRFRHLIKP